jgi:hypothetical protein
MTVLLPTASDLRRALTRHDEAVGRDERRSTPETVRAREDSAYTLCVMTGTTGVEEARRAAAALLGRDTATVTQIRRPAAATLAASSMEEAAARDRVALPQAA